MLNMDINMQSVQTRVEKCVLKESFYSIVAGLFAGGFAEGRRCPSVEDQEEQIVFLYLF